MDAKSIIDDALNLSPAERLIIIETLSKSLSEPHLDIEQNWKKEVEHRYSAYLDGEIKSIPYQDLLKK